MKMSAALAAASVALLAAAALAVAPAPAQAKAEGYKIDPAHSFALFRVKHLNIGAVHGRFNDVSGTIDLDEENPSASSVQVVIQAASVDTGVAKRDTHLRSPDFLNVAQFPTLSFKSTAVKKADETHYEVTGDLTLHGVTKPVTVTMEKGGPGKDPWGKTRVGFEGTFTIQRSQFGMTGLLEPGGDDVRITVAVEAAQP